MTLTWWKLGGRFGAMALIGLSTVIAQAADDQQQPAAQSESSQAKPAQDAAETPRAAAKDATTAEAAPPAPAAPLPLPEYWLGIEVMPVSEAICSQLGLQEGEGLLVERLVEGGPAVQCGIQQYDIILTVGDTPVRTPADLVKMLVEGKNQEIEFRILRAGKKQAVKVKPGRRPAPQAGQPVPQGSHAANGRAMELLREQLDKARLPLRLQFFHPGILLPPGALTAPIPEDLHLSIKKQGSKPARIVVERGDQRWETTEDKLAELPDGIRPHVEALLGRLPMPKFDVEVDPDAAPALGPPLQPQVSERLEKRLEELTRQMEQMSEQLEQLREEHPDAASEE